MPVALRAFKKCLPLVFVFAACAVSDSEPLDNVSIYAPEPLSSEQTAQPDRPLWTAVAQPVAYAQLPGWNRASLMPGVAALKRSCQIYMAAPPQAHVSPRAQWAGRYGDWKPACAALELVSDAQSGRAVFEALFRPVEIQDSAHNSRITGYFEPTIQVRARPSGEFTEPIPALPDDLVEKGGKVYQRSRQGRLMPYPERRDITRRGVEALAYAHPGDVFFLQIQGSGRLVFPDGRVLRAAYAANNGQPFRSTANWLMQKGWIDRSEASMSGIKAWMSRTSPRRMRMAMNANPRFVFFRPEAITDPGLGPRGAFGVPLTPMGSLAVDPAYHASGIPMYLETQAPGLSGTWRGLVAAQDAGGAIKGPIRGDLYFGTGPEAGRAAETLNASGRLWVFLPRNLAERLQAGL